MSEDELSKEGEEMGLRFDNKISTGHILTAAALFASGVAAFMDVKADIAHGKTRDDEMMAKIITAEADAKQSEARIRAVEIAQASQSSDLRSIQGGIARIEMQLEKLSKN